MMSRGAAKPPRISGWLSSVIFVAKPPAFVYFVFFVANNFVSLVAPSGAA
jgi:hypothetical protein